MNITHRLIRSEACTSRNGWVKSTTSILCLVIYRGAAAISASYNNGKTISASLNNRKNNISPPRTIGKNNVTPNVTFWQRVKIYLSNVMTKWICTIKKSSIHFSQKGNLNLWLMTLTFKIIQDIVNVYLCTECWVHTSKSLAIRVLNGWQTHLYKRDQFYTLDCWHR